MENEKKYFDFREIFETFQGHQRYQRLRRIFLVVAIAAFVLALKRPLIDQAVGCRL